VDASKRFLGQEQASHGVGYLKRSFEAVNGHVPLPTAPGLDPEVVVDWQQWTGLRQSRDCFQRTFWA